MKSPKQTSLYGLFLNMLDAAGDQRAHLRRSFFTAIASAFVEACALLSLCPLFLSVLSPESVDVPWFWVSVFFVLMLVQAAIGYKDFMQQHSQHYVNFGHNLKLRIAQKLRNITQETLDRERTGEITTAVAASVEEVVMMSHVVAKMFLRPIVIPVVVVLGMLFVDWRIALMMLFLFPFGVFLYMRNRVKVAHHMDELLDARKTLSADVLEYVQGVAVLRACDAQGAQSAQLHKSVEAMEHIQHQGMMKSIVPKVLFASLIEMGLLLCVAISVWLIGEQSMPMAVLVALMVIVTRFAEPVTLFLEFVAGFEVFRKGIDSIDELMAMPTLPHQNAKADTSVFDINISNVCYMYPEGNVPAINKLSLSIKARSMVALVGESGSGKTTLTKLLMRYGDTQAGGIHIGGIDIKTLPQDELMSYFSVVFQDVLLFDDSIINNIRVGCPSASDDDVKHAARLAHCDEFIERLPEGYQTRVGEIGGRLSGGEKQRISIARAILKDAPIIILDEPTASLDTESERFVQRAIDALVQNRTVIVIAHRLSTIVGADNIVVMGNGNIIEQGTHQELLNQQGKYHALWQAQQSSQSWRA